MAITSIPIVDTKSLFISLLKRLGCDLVLDIGSRDGRQAMLFRDTLPAAEVIAYEANPHNHRRIAADPNFTSRGIQLRPTAVSNSDGKAHFFIAKADYTAPETLTNNLGTSSLLDGAGWQVAERVEVETERLDTALCRPNTTGKQRIALWIDVEGAEYFVFEGLGKEAKRVALIHVETALEPLRPGQKSFGEIKSLLAAQGFEPIGSNIPQEEKWGDVVFANLNLLKDRDGDLRAALRMARFQQSLGASQLAVKLKRIPWLFRLARWLFIRAS